MAPTELIVIVSLVFALFAIGLVWLVWEQHKLKHANQALFEQLESINKDVAGLCSAAVKVDSRLSLSGEQLADLFEKLSTFERQETEVSPYHSVIQKVRAGSSVQELIKECGLSRDEAALLVKLHGTNGD